MYPSRYCICNWHSLQVLIQTEQELYFSVQTSKVHSIGICPFSESAEAEHIASFNSSRSVFYYRQFLELSITQHTPTTIWVDNTAAIAQSKKPVKLQSFHGLLLFKTIHQCCAPGFVRPSRRTVTHTRDTHTRARALHTHARTHSPSYCNALWTHTSLSYLASIHKKWARTRAHVCSMHTRLYAVCILASSISRYVCTVDFTTMHKYIFYWIIMPATVRILPFCVLSHYFDFIPETRQEWQGCGIAVLR